MDQPKLGQLITDAGAGRDAIHVAVAPVIAAERLSPGEHVGFVPGQDSIVTGDTDRLIGIVDPYLKAPVRKGQMFYLCLYPQTITSLRHVWTHPAFEEEGEKPAPVKTPADASRVWLEGMAARVGLSYDRLMAAAHACVADGDYFVHMGENEDYKDAFWGHEEEFWKHFEAVTGVKPSDPRASFFSCSC